MTPQQILDHHDSGQPWPDAAGSDLADLPPAYQTALAVRALRLARGELPRGYKVGFTNRTIWPRYNVFAPIWGTVWNTTLTLCDGAGRVSLAHTCQPRLEPEAVFGFKATPCPGARLQDLFDALDWVAPGFEIVQSHRQDWKFNAAQTVADGGLHAHLLIGPRVPVAALAQDAEQLHQLLAGARMGLHKNGRLVEEGAGGHVLDSPLRALLHFTQALRACPGATDLMAGDVVTTGTWTDAWPVAAGETWNARFDAALPALEIRFD
jgi:2-oxo-3-hexenedioate decarboxylase